MSTPPNQLIPLLIFGTRDKQSFLHVFLRDIDAFRMLIAAVCRCCFKEFVQKGVTLSDDNSYFYVSYKNNPIEKGLVLFPLEDVTFPPPLRDSAGNPRDFHVNMMPFEMRCPEVLNLAKPISRNKRIPTFVNGYEQTAEGYGWKAIEATLPTHCKRYAPLLAAALRRVPNEWGKIGYLTIHESFVAEGETQRRPGLHIESPGALNSGPPLKAHAYHKFYCWGEGKFGSHERGDVDEFGQLRVQGGIFMASNMDDTCQAWDCVIQDHGNVVFSLGNIEHMRDAIGGDEAGVKLKANQLAWLTDRTPHESLKQKQSGFRQFFRLVTSELSVWYKEHNTPNELGTQPACDILLGNKFE